MALKHFTLKLQYICEFNKTEKGDDYGKLCTVNAIIGLIKLN